MTSLPTTTTAWRLQARGSPATQLALDKDVPIPELKPGQVLVAIEQASINPGAWIVEQQYIMSSGGVVAHIIRSCCTHQPPQWTGRSHLFSLASFRTCPAQWAPTLSVVSSPSRRLQQLLMVTLCPR
jgi:hypothetical protein